MKTFHKKQTFGAFCQEINKLLLIHISDRGNGLLNNVKSLKDNFEGI